jgi:hypothetical protein
LPKSWRNSSVSRRPMTDRQLQKRHALDQFRVRSHRLAAQPANARPPNDSTGLDSHAVQTAQTRLAVWAVRRAGRGNAQTSGPPWWWCWWWSSSARGRLMIWLRGVAVLRHVFAETWPIVGPSSKANNKRRTALGSALTALTRWRGACSYGCWSRSTRDILHWTCKTILFDVQYPWIRRLA